MHYLNIVYNDTNSSFIYLDDRLFVNTPYLLIDSKLEQNKAQIKQLIAKDFDIKLQGQMVVDLENDTYDFMGALSSHELNASVYLVLQGDNIGFAVYGIDVPSIDTFMDALAKKVNMDENLKKWIHIYIKANKYEIFDFSGYVNLQNSNDMQLYGTARGENIKLNFIPELDEVSVESVEIDLKDDTLSFALHNPSFHNKSLEGSNVQVKNLIGTDSHVLIDLRSNELNYEDIKHILKAFNISYADFQINAPLDSQVLIDIKIEPFSIKANGEFIMPATTLKSKNSTFKTKGAKIALKEDIIDIKQANLNGGFFDVDFSGEFHTTTQQANLQALFNKIYIKNLLEMKDSNQSVKIDTNESFKLNIPGFGFKANMKNTNKEQSLIKIDDIGKLKKYSKLANDLNISSGSVQISTSDFSDFNIELNKAKFDLGLQNLNNQAYNSDDFMFNGTFNNADISSKSGHLGASIKQGKTQIRLKDLIIPIDTNSSGMDDLNMAFSAKNTSLNLKDINRTLKFESFNGIFDNNSLNFSASFEKGNLNIQKTPFNVKIDGSNIPDSFVNELLGTNTFVEGLFSLRLFGRDFEHFKAEIKAKDTYLTNYKIQNGLLGFLDSVPSLLIFKVPDFSNKGFSVESGTILLDKNGPQLEIKAAQLDGKNADISGSGGINLKNGNIRVDLELSILKSYATILGYIPVINKILLGDDNRIFTIIQIRGTLDEPKFNSSVGADIAKTPFNIIKNTLTLPFNMF